VATRGSTQRPPAPEARRRPTTPDDVATGEKLARAGDGADARRMDVVVDLEQWRRAQRLLPIFIDRFGVSYFVQDGGRLDDTRLARCAELAGDWIERRSGRLVDATGRERLYRMLRDRVAERLAEGQPVRQR
jgi:hypothetical protein